MVQSDWQKYSRITLTIELDTASESYYTRRSQTFQPSRDFVLRPGVKGFTPFAQRFLVRARLPGHSRFLHQSDNSSYDVCILLTIQ